MPRPTKLNADVQKKIIDALQAGNYFDAACEYAGISGTTGYNWMKRGREELERRDNPRIKEGTEQWKKEQPFLEFFEAISRASASIEVHTLAIIQKAGRGTNAIYDDEGNVIMPAIPPDWRALTWFMEHRYPKKWGKQYSESKNEHEHKGQIIIQTGMNLDDL